MADERENWISEELVLVNMNIIPCLFTQLWSANISIDISSWLFHPFLENIREFSVKASLLASCLFIHIQIVFIFLLFFNLTKQLQLCQSINLTLHSPMKASPSFGSLLARVRTFVQTGTGQTDLAVNNKAKYCVQSWSDGVASLIFIIMWLWCQNSQVTLDN